MISEISPMSSTPSDEDTVMQRACTTNYFRVLGEAMHCRPPQAWDETARFGAKHPFPAALHGYSAQEVPDLTAKRLLE